MGLGKTFVGAEKLTRYEKKVNLVICQKSKINDWKEHFERYYPHYRVLDITKKSGLEEFNELSHEKTKRVIGIINYELAWRRQELTDLTDFTLMLDESSKIQNQKAKQTKYILKLKPAHTILLSGTPTSGKYENLWSQMHLLGWNISNQLYNEQYVNWRKLETRTMTIPIVDKKNPYKNVERLKTKLRQHGAIFMKTEECFDLPEQNFQIIKVPQTAAYKKFSKNKIVTVDGQELVGETILTERLIKRQLCGSYSEPKLTALSDLIESTQDRLIIFYNFNSELDALKKIASDHDRPVSLINGQTKDLKAYEEESNSITLIQYQAGAMGLNLQKANRIIYFTLTEKSELFEQSKKRIHRIGQSKPCYYYLLITENSIEEEEILPTLKIRQEYTDDLFED
jgi:SNF2 family DNA or RNA helicase